MEPSIHKIHDYIIKKSRDAAIRWLIDDYNYSRSEAERVVDGIIQGNRG